MGRKVYHCLVFFFFFFCLAEAGHSCIGPGPSLSDNTNVFPSSYAFTLLFRCPASHQHVRCLFSEIPAHICAPLIHLSSFMSSALVEQRHKSHPEPPSHPPTHPPIRGWTHTRTHTHTHTQQKATTSHWSPEAAAETTVGPPSNPATPCTADYFGPAPCFSDTKAVKGADASVLAFHSLGSDGLL